MNGNGNEPYSSCIPSGSLALSLGLCIFLKPTDLWVFPLPKPSSCNLTPLMKYNYFLDSVISAIIIFCYSTSFLCPTFQTENTQRQNKTP